MKDRTEQKRKDRGRFPLVEGTRCIYSRREVLASSISRSADVTRNVNSSAREFDFVALTLSLFFSVSCCRITSFCVVGHDDSDA